MMLVRFIGALSMSLTWERITAHSTGRILGAVATLSFLHATVLSIKNLGYLGSIAYYVSVATEVVILAVFCILLDRERRLSLRVRQLERQAATDHLTGLDNRRSFEHRYEMFAQQDGGCAAMLIIDIDHFKRVNDIYGHAIGDKILKLVATSIINAVRQDDIVARIGGEEFAVLLSRISQDQAKTAALRIRESVASSFVRVGEDIVSVTVSIGARLLERPQSLTECFDSADKALYAAKQAGRNAISYALPSGELQLCVM